MAESAFQVRKEGRKYAYARFSGNPNFAKILGLLITLQNVKTCPNLPEIIGSSSNPLLSHL
jgi:hypothetical protein